jgi:hypothetical protein
MYSGGEFMIEDIYPIHRTIDDHMDMPMEWSYNEH